LYYEQNQKEVVEMPKYAEGRLSDKQRKWIDYYKQGKTAREAAELAGYHANSRHSFENIGSQNVKKLAQYIKDHEDVLDRDHIAAMNDINQFWTEIMNDENAALQHRLKASELRAKAAGGFLDHTNVHVAGGVIFIAGEDEIED